MKKVTPYTKSWYEKAFQLLRSYVPGLYPCHKCGNPVISGYCCTYCGDSNPSENDEDE